MLPEKEFLSRYDHKPFTTEDYEPFNALLADSYLLHGNVSLEALIEQSPSDNKGIDGVSGATSTAVSDDVVKGAV